MNISADSANDLWLRLLDELLHLGRIVAPRGMKTREIIPMHLELTDVDNNLITIAMRKLNYPFMVAEWFWIMAGRYDVESISFYNKQIAQFSDNGTTFFGAYGPKIRGQLGYVVETLKRDPDSRQAVLTIWRESPPQTKDVPCTISIQYLLRDRKLEAVITMRSSDAWLGLPYDIFNFTRTQSWVAACLGVKTGGLHLTLGSSHLYERNWEDAQRIIGDYALYNQRGTSPIIREAVTHEVFKDIEEAARVRGEVITSYGSPWTDYSEALVSRHRKLVTDAAEGSGHMAQLINQMIVEQRYIEEGDDGSE